MKDLNACTEVRINQWRKRPWRRDCWNHTRAFWRRYYRPTNQQFSNGKRITPYSSKLVKLFFHHYLEIFLSPPLFLFSAPMIFHKPFALLFLFFFLLALPAAASPVDTISARATALAFLERKMPPQGRNKAEKKRQAERLSALQLLKSMPAAHIFRHAAKRFRHRGSRQPSA